MSEMRKNDRCVKNDRHVRMKSAARQCRNRSRRDERTKTNAFNVFVGSLLEWNGEREKRDLIAGDFSILSLLCLQFVLNELVVMRGPVA